MTLTFAQHVAIAIIASGREVTQSDLDRALRMGRWVADGMDAPDLKAAMLAKMLARMEEGWGNALELGIIAEQHRTSAAILRDQARAALAEYEARG